VTNSDAMIAISILALFSKLKTHFMYHWYN